MIHAVPIDFDEACEFIARLHRHHVPPQGWKFGIGCADETGKLVGVAIVGRPVSRMRDNGWTMEVTRLCTDGTKNAASFLYSACWRAARAMGYTRMGTYLLKSETGASVAAAGWRLVHETKGGSWSRENRERCDKHPLESKTLWEVREAKAGT